MAEGGDRAMDHTRDMESRAVRNMSWGGCLLGAAALVWFYLLWSLLGEHQGPVCGSRSFGEPPRGADCAADEWGWLLTVLVASLPVATLGSILWVRGSVSLRMAEYVRETRPRR